MGLLVARGAGDPEAVRAADDPVKAVIGLEGIAASRDEIGDALEGFPVDPRIRLGAANFVIKLGQPKALAAGPAHDVLGKDIERARSRPLPVYLACFHGCLSCAAFEHFKPVCRHKEGFGGLVHPVVGAANALDEAGRALRRAHLDDEIDLAPVDAEIEGGRADDGLELASGHGGLDALALVAGERAVMERDG